MSPGVRGSSSSSSSSRLSAAPMDNGKRQQQQHQLLQHEQQQHGIGTECFAAAHMLLDLLGEQLAAGLFCWKPQKPRGNGG